MAERLLGYGPQGLALEVNPWQTKSSIEAAHMFRGAIVGAWASVETYIIEIAIRSSIHPAYIGIRAAYPSKLKGRVAYLRTIVELDGPLVNYRKLVETVLRRYEESAPARNRMAHSRMIVQPDWGVTFYGFLPKSDKVITYDMRRFTPVDLETEAQRATRFARSVAYLVARLNQLELLPALNELSGDH
ncbi:hypothetical protein [uncultured Sphingomonas sp.]|uniref:hypothetical protein n=1 Tax=uncultured Sphingomonas sp. TaxID=158754 RepID=UPI0035CAEB3A